MMNIFDYAYLIPLLPFLGFLINRAWKKSYSRKTYGNYWKRCSIYFFLLSILIFISVSKEGFTAQHIIIFLLLILKN